MQTARILEIASSVDPDDVEMHYIDRTGSETEESYVVLQRGKKPLDEEHFTAAALVAIAGHMGCAPSDLNELEVIHWSPEGWHNLQLEYIKPGQVQCFPPAAMMEFEIPLQVQPKYKLEPQIGGFEECMLCGSTSGHVLLYWHTTG